jgi:hypothetical protein
MTHFLFHFRVGKSLATSIVVDVVKNTRLTMVVVVVVSNLMIRWSEN